MTIFLFNIFSILYILILILIIFSFLIDNRKTEDFPLINAGICGFGYNRISLDDNDDYNGFDKYRVEGGEGMTWITSIGHRLKDILIIEK